MKPPVERPPPGSVPRRVQTEFLERADQLAARRAERTSIPSGHRPPAARPPAGPGRGLRRPPTVDPVPSTFLEMRRAWLGSIRAPPRGARGASRRPFTGSVGCCSAPCAPRRRPLLASVRQRTARASARYARQRARGPRARPPRTMSPFLPGGIDRPAAGAVVPSTTGSPRRGGRRSPRGPAGSSGADARGPRAGLRRCHRLPVRTSAESMPARAAASMSRPFRRPDDLGGRLRRGAPRRRSNIPGSGLAGDVGAAGGVTEDATMEPLQGAEPRLGGQGDMNCGSPAGSVPDRVSTLREHGRRPGSSPPADGDDVLTVRRRR